MLEVLDRFDHRLEFPRSLSLMMLEGHKLLVVKGHQYGAGGSKLVQNHLSWVVWVP